ncbi:hypothetical protein H2203_005926 [Taxawa tesnikishii (nom. ined.)]|nr:hypothetical protein H2203_005926 [Dothideales sp. JES 119]
MPKERTINPAQAQRKADKARALKKGKSEALVRRNEKLARRNPERIQRQIDELKELESHGGLRPKDKETLDSLEKDLKAVRRAREALGDNAPSFGQGGNKERRGVGDGRGGLGKRRRDDRDAYRREESSDTDEHVRDIPMPRDTPPPIPRRQPRHQPQNQDKPAAPAVAQTVYSSAPVVRDLAKEARRFVPAAVAQNIARTKGQGGRLLEPEELDKLEKAGYGDAQKAAEEAEREASYSMMADDAAGGGKYAGGASDGDGVEEQTRALERDPRKVEMEEVEDEDL